MGIFDFFKKKPQEVKTEQKEFINLKDLDKWIDEKSSILQIQKNKFHNLVKNSLSNLSKEIDQHTANLENISWEKIKEEERIKQIVRENLNNYKTYLKQLMIDLNKLEESNLSKETILSMFLAFEKKAAMNYQKSTYLIGKEIELVNKSISLFFKDIDKLHEDNKGVIKKAKSLQEIKKNLIELENLEKTISQFNEDIIKMEQEIIHSKNEIENYKLSLNETLKGTEYKSWQKRNKELQIKKENLSKEIQKLSALIDFKKLAKIWHENVYEMSSLTEYRSNFIQTFQSDKGELLRKLIEQLENKEIIKRTISKINELEREIEGTIIEQSPSINFERKIEEAIGKISNNQENHLAENKKLEKVILTKKPVIAEIKNNLIEFNPELVINF